MSDLFGNPEDRFSRVAAHMFIVVINDAFMCFLCGLTYIWVYRSLHGLMVAKYKLGCVGLILVLRLKFILLINVKMPTLAGILTFISSIDYCLMGFMPEFSTDFGYFSIYEQLHAQLN